MTLLAPQQGADHCQSMCTILTPIRIRVYTFNTNPYQIVTTAIWNDSGAQDSRWFAWVTVSFTRSATTAAAPPRSCTSHAPLETEYHRRVGCDWFRRPEPAFRVPPTPASGLLMRWSREE